MWRLLCLSLLIARSWALYPLTGNVLELTPSNFDSLVTKSDEVWVVEFFAPWCGHCKNLVPEYTKAANALKGVVQVGAVNADQHKDLAGKYGVQGFPTIKIFSINKNKPANFNGQTAEGIVNAAFAAVKAKVKNALGAGSSSSGGSKDDVVQLNEPNFDKLVLKSDDIWLVEFFAPWCSHCKTLAPHWAKAASELKGKVKFGAIDATINLSKASEYGVQGYPTIKYFPAGPKTQNSAQDYDGGRTSTEIVNWSLEKLAESIPAPEVTQIINEDNLRTACEDKPLCVVSILPHIYDCQSECRNNYIKMLTDLGDKFKKKMWGWVWSEAGAQPELEHALDIGGFGYPAMVVVSAKKMKYSVLRGAYSKDGISGFLRDLSYGKSNTAPVKGIPKIVKVKPWNGEDAKLLIEEDVNLSHVNLDEKDEL